MILRNTQDRAHDIRINAMALIAWKAHNDYPNPLPKPANYPGLVAERWRWFGGSTTEPPAWIYVTESELAIRSTPSWWERFMRKLFNEDHFVND